jgi:Family of unknown function (DUF6188)
MVGELVEAADRWLVPMAGTVTQCRLDYAFSLVVADESAGSFEVRIEQPSAVSSQDDEVLLDPEGDPVQMAPALRVLRREVEQAIAAKGGRGKPGRLLADERGGGSSIPGFPFRGPNAPERAYENLAKHHGVDRGVASDRLHKIKEAGGLGATDDVVIGRTRDVYDARTEEWLGRLTDKSLGP